MSDFHDLLFAHVRCTVLLEHVAFNHVSLLWNIPCAMNQEPKACAYLTKLDFRFIARTVSFFTRQGHTKVSVFGKSYASAALCMPHKSLQERFPAH